MLIHLIIGLALIRLDITPRSPVTLTSSPFAIGSCGFWFAYEEPSDI